MTAPKIDTQAPDTSREAVERLASFHEGVARSFQDHIRGAYPVSHKGHAVVAATLRALLAERDLADARAAAAWIAGRDAAVKLNDQRIRDYVQEHGSTDPSTGIVEFSDAGEEWIDDRESLTHAIRDLTPPSDASAALDRLIAERVREAVDGCIETIRQEAQKGDISEGAAQWCIDTIRAARGSKEGRDATDR